MVNILKEIKCWLSKFLKLGLDQVNEHINGWESWYCVTLVKHDCLFNISISVLTGSIEVHKLSIQIVEV